MKRIYVHPAPEFYPSFCGLEKFMGVLQFGFAFQTVQSLPCSHFCCAHASSSSMPSFRLCLFYLLSVVCCQGGVPLPRCKGQLSCTEQRGKPKSCHKAVGADTDCVECPSQRYGQLVPWLPHVPSWECEQAVCCTSPAISCPGLTLRPCAFRSGWTPTASEEGYVFLLTITYCSTRWVKAILLKNMERPRVRNI